MDETIAMHSEGAEIKIHSKYTFAFKKLTFAHIIHAEQPIVIQNIRKLHIQLTEI